MSQVFALLNAHDVFSNHPYCVHVHATAREGLVGSFRNFSCESIIVILYCGFDSFLFYFLYSPVWYDREEIMEVEEMC